MNNRIGLVAITLALAGCAMAHNVAQLGPDTYTVSASASSMRGGASAARGIAVERAGEYCRSLGREIMVLHISGETTNFQGGGGTDVTFRCLPKGDPVH